MKAAFKNFMTGLIDYAGMFPPAGLDVAAAVAQYAGYLEGGDGWMLGRCIIPAARLQSVSVRPEFRFSGIVSPEMVQEELDQLSAFTGRVEMVETRVPENTDSPARYAACLRHLQTRLAGIGLQHVQLFVEAENAAAAAAAIGAFNSSAVEGEVAHNVGFKLRCGGLTKQSCPAPEKVAEAISSCYDHNIPIKFTAGLHQPLSNYSPEPGTLQYGFINIFGAALLCWSRNISRSEIVECLCDKTARHFQFTRETFSWKDKTISAEAIERLRRSKIISFGSCSFAEPVAGLGSLGFQGNNKG